MSLPENISCLAREPRVFVPTLRENEALPQPTLGSWPFLVMWFEAAIRVYIDVYVEASIGLFFIHGGYDRLFTILTRDRLTPAQLLAS